MVGYNHFDWKNMRRTIERHKSEAFDHLFDGPHIKREYLKNYAVAEWELNSGEIKKIKQHLLWCNKGDNNCQSIVVKEIEAEERQGRNAQVPVGDR